MRALRLKLIGSLAVFENLGNLTIRAKCWRVRSFGCYGARSLEVFEVYVDIGLGNCEVLEKNSERL
jgi:hypothetical protein